MNKEDNLENCPDCGEDMPGSKIRCTRCQRQHDDENTTEADYRAIIITGKYGVTDGR
ncbi:hypothetical protein [Buttiauxella sp. 3AFRM03]|uniref:hypothetical protein n=1 Tax=Buttiauxella sp. 3AFRM03 TaxID=2479367 RepID=UPI001390633F|nr:hypothetical protein [Buttiauxella sp. 3AFRM03]